MPQTADWCESPALWCPRLRRARRRIDSARLKRAAATLRGVPFDTSINSVGVPPAKETRQIPSRLAHRIVSSSSQWAPPLLARLPACSVMVTGVPPLIDTFLNSLPLQKPNH